MPRPRTLRRKRERDLRTAVKRLERVAAAAPGGAPEHPIDVTSASVVEGRARSTPCPLCGGDLELVAHEAAAQGGELLRRVVARCRLCHAERRLWFRVAPRLPS